MAVRTDSDSVELIIEVDDDIALGAFISTANELVTEMCTGDNGPDTAYSDERLELIERWLAAHFYAVREFQPSEEKAGSASAVYERKTGLFLNQTVYGQQAMVLDTNQGLASLGRTRVGVAWMGTEEDDA